MILLSFQINYKVDTNKEYHHEQGKYYILDNFQVEKSVNLQANYSDLGERLEEISEVSPERVGWLVLWCCGDCEDQEQ